MTQRETLQRLLVSKGFRCQQAKEVLRYGAWTEVPPGERLLSQDDPTPYLAFMKSGEVKLLIKHPSNTSFVRVVSLGEGRVIGWEPLVGAHRHGKLSLRGLHHQSAMQLFSSEARPAKTSCSIECIVPRTPGRFCASGEATTRLTASSSVPSPIVYDR